MVAQHPQRRMLTGILPVELQVIGNGRADLNIRKIPRQPVHQADAIPWLFEIQLYLLDWAAPLPNLVRQLRYRPPKSLKEFF